MREKNRQFFSINKHFCPAFVLVETSGGFSQKIFPDQSVSKLPGLLIEINTRKYLKDSIANTYQVAVNFSSNPKKPLKKRNFYREGVRKIMKHFWDFIGEKRKKKREVQKTSTHKGGLYKSFFKKEKKEQHTIVRIFLRLIFITFKPQKPAKNEARNAKRGEEFVKTVLLLDSNRW